MADPLDTSYAASPAPRKRPAAPLLTPINLACLAVPLDQRPAVREGAFHFANLVDRFGMALEEARRRQVPGFELAPDYLYMTGAVAALLREHGAEAAWMQGFLRALVDLLVHIADGALPDNLAHWDPLDDWDPIDNTGRSFGERALRELPAPVAYDEEDVPVAAPAAKAPKKPAAKKRAPRPAKTPAAEFPGWMAGGAGARQAESRP